MEKMSLIGMKKEMGVLVHLNQIINDFVDMMGVQVITHVDPNYFEEICRDFIKLIDDSPYITSYLKHIFSEFLMHKVHKCGPVSAQGQELKKFTEFIGDNINRIRETYIDEYDGSDNQNELLKRKANY